jgi:hypothetical protein
MWWLLACSSADPDPAVPLDAAAIEVLTELDLALERVRRRDPEAGAAVEAAYARFEEDLEPALRARLPASEVLALEYGFARVQAAAGDPTRADQAAAALAAQIEAATRSTPTIGATTGATDGPAGGDPTDPSPTGSTRSAPTGSP